MHAKSIAYLLAAIASLLVMPNMASAQQEEVQAEESFSGVPVRNAILTRRYGTDESEPEVAAQEIEAGWGATPTFQQVRYRRYYRPYGYYGYYGGPRYYSYYGGPRYYGHYGPRVYTSFYGPGPGAYYGYPYGAYYSPYYYAPRPYFYGYYGGYYPPNWGGAYYW